MDRTVPDPDTETRPRLWESVAVALVSVVTVVTEARALAPYSARDVVTVLLLTVGCGALAWWRPYPRLATTVGLTTLTLGSVGLSSSSSGDALLVFLVTYFALAAVSFTGWQTWLVFAGLAVVVAVLISLDPDSAAGFLVLTAPGYLAGAALRPRRTAAALAQRVAELEQERELYAELSVRAERTRIAAELHDVVGHALSVMVVQAAAGQRLVDRDPASAGRSLAAIAESARQGRVDLQRLVDLLGGTEQDDAGLSLVDDAVRHAARAGLDVQCVFAGDLDGVPATASHLAFRVVQEGLTNALRHAPGAPVRVRVEATDGAVSVVVENDAAVAHPTGLVGSGRGLQGLGDRVRDLGGSLTAGALPGGRWAVRASLPTSG